MKRHIFLLLTTLLVLWSCGGDDSPPPSPAAAQLVFPEQNSECTTGVNINTNQSRVTFSWEASDNTDTYRLTVTNLIFGSSNNYDTEATSFDVTLQKGQPYSWSVTSASDNSSQTSQSEVWSFYNAGDGITSYAPFPAGASFPEMGATVVPTGGNLTLRWNGADVDDDISSYDIYLEDVNPPSAVVATTVSSEFFQVSGLAAATVYYWQVVTRDLEGNTSASPVFEFRTVD